MVKLGEWSYMQDGEFRADGGKNGRKMVKNGGKMDFWANKGVQ